MTNHTDIPKYPESNYSVNVEWRWLGNWLNSSDYTLDMNPDFQRAHVWTRRQQRLYIEHILMEGRSGRDVYWNHPEWMGTFEGAMELVDGKQRLEAVRAFLNNKVRAFGLLYREHDEKMVRSRRCDFKFHIAVLKTRREVLKWYLAINAGGTPHSPEELKRVRALLRKEPA